MELKRFFEFQFLERFIEVYIFVNIEIDLRYFFYFFGSFIENLVKFKIC